MTAGDANTFGNCRHVYFVRVIVLNKLQRLVHIDGAAGGGMTARCVELNELGEKEQ